MVFPSRRYAVASGVTISLGPGGCYATNKDIGDDDETLGLVRSRWGLRFLPKVKDAKKREKRQDGGTSCGGGPDLRWSHKEASALYHVVRTMPPSLPMSGQDGNQINPLVLLTNNRPGSIAPVAWSLCVQKVQRTRENCGCNQRSTMGWFQGHRATEPVLVTSHDKPCG